MLKLYGHPFSSYTWKALIALYANDTPFTFHTLDGDQPEAAAIVAAASPLGKFPLLVDGDIKIFEATAIIEYLAALNPGSASLIPAGLLAATQARMWDRVFDNYVMNIMQIAVNEAIHSPGNLDEVRIAAMEGQLDRVYDWLEAWLADYERPDHITIVECAAAPSLFYADWVYPIGPTRPRLMAWRAHLLALPEVSRCVEDARPFRHYFPLGAPDRD
ncbi:glutathione S-transferase family protein [Sphingorhabdus soli]|uniref:Glutathione S-transferase family protein n=1 Tax=Flavisphingopyxis soli TaxID=2601267 RepID=A0A5C6U6G4_9SPHN|nr:glutathione S-transferase family protein [Sphingorhabdus soli]TXC68359.1 glutathione S-transferase family protein [Sphingorhabdus soli]